MLKIKEKIMKTFMYESKKEYFEVHSKKIDNIEGSLVEMGFGVGGSANIFGDLMAENKIKKRHMWLFDSFQGFPEPTKGKDSPKNKKGQWANGNQNESIKKLKRKIGGHESVSVIPGFFEDTIPESYVGGSIAILHLDCDLYMSYKVSLEGLYDMVQPGGLILFDEYKSPVQMRKYPGAHKAIDEFFKNKDVEFIKGQSKNNKELQKYCLYKPVK